MIKHFPTLWKTPSSALSKEAEKLFADFNSVFLDVDRAFESFDRTFPIGVRNVTFPPCDVIKTDTGYEVAIAVAGFSKEELTVELDGDNVIMISGKKESKPSDNYLVKGIATRQFVRKWALDGSDEVEDVILKDGLLTVKIKRNEPTPKETTKLLDIKVK